MPTSAPAAGSSGHRTSTTALRPPGNVLMLLPPDFMAPWQQKTHRFPPQGPALVAAAIAPDGFRVRAIDLELSVTREPLSEPLERLEDGKAIAESLAGGDTKANQFVDEILRRVDPHGADYIAFSIDRHTQTALTLLLAREARLRWKRPVIIGGASARAGLHLARAVGVEGIDVMTPAESPDEIRMAFGALREATNAVPGEPVDPIARAVKTPADDWPVPDYGIYDLDLYRRDPFEVESFRFPAYRGQYGRQLVLPYHMAFACQFACAFCQNGGRQAAKSPERVARDLAELSERFETNRFMFFDAQINVMAREVSQALIDARVDVQWTDSYRVAPNKPGTLELMAEAGCVGITVGVESASDDMLKRMVKGHRQKHATRLVHQANALEIFTRVNLLTCFPHETAEDHRISCDWLQENASAIDDIAPSSFYLVGDSPVARDPERFGIRIRGDRELDGDYKFRKGTQPMTYDEIGGLSWEEREPTLRAQENELREAWLAGRGKRAPLDGLTTMMVSSMRGNRATKDEAYADVLAWFGGHAEPGRHGDDTGPAAHLAGDWSAPTIVRPAAVDDAVVTWFDTIVADAEDKLRHALGLSPRGHVVLFDTGDYVFFRGTVDASVEDGDGTVTIRDLVAYRVAEDSPYRSSFGALAPGTEVPVRGGALILPRRTGSGTEDVPFPLGERCHVLTFGPAESESDAAG